MLNKNKSLTGFTHIIIIRWENSIGHDRADAAGIVVIDDIHDHRDGGTDRHGDAAGVGHVLLVVVVVCLILQQRLCHAPSVE